VIDLYDAWWDKRAPEHTRAEPAAARRRAIAGNCCAGAGLDDELDTPAIALPANGNLRPAPASPPTSARAHGSPGSKAHMTLTIHEDHISNDQTGHSPSPSVRGGSRAP